MIVDNCLSGRLCVWTMVFVLYVFFLVSPIYSIIMAQAFLLYLIKIVIGVSLNAFAVKIGRTERCQRKYKICDIICFPHEYLEELYTWPRVLEL